LTVRVWKSVECNQGWLLNGAGSWVCLFLNVYILLTSSGMYILQVNMILCHLPHSTHTYWDDFLTYPLFVWLHWDSLWISCIMDWPLDFVWFWGWLISGWVSSTLEHTTNKVVICIHSSHSIFRSHCQMQLTHLHFPKFLTQISMFFSPHSSVSSSKAALSVFSIQWPFIPF
jgi:hypothetical protein